MDEHDESIGVRMLQELADSTIQGADELHEVDSFLVKEDPERPTVGRLGNDASSGSAALVDVDFLDDDVGRWAVGGDVVGR